MLIFACPIFPQTMSNQLNEDHEENHQKTATISPRIGRQTGGIVQKTSTKITQNKNVPQ